MLLSTTTLDWNGLILLAMPQVVPSIVAIILAVKAPAPHGVDSRTRATDQPAPPSSA